VDSVSEMEIDFKGLLVNLLRLACALCAERLREWLWEKDTEIQRSLPRGRYGYGMYGRGRSRRPSGRWRSVDVATGTGRLGNTCSCWTGRWGDPRGVQPGHFPALDHGTKGFASLFRKLKEVPVNF